LFARSRFSTAELVVFNSGAGQTCGFSPPDSWGDRRSGLVQWFLGFALCRPKQAEFGQPEARLIFRELSGNLGIKQASETSAIASAAQGRDNTALFYPAWAGFSSPGAASNEAVFP
jgi:hypothetical protein